MRLRFLNLKTLFALSLLIANAMHLATSEAADLPPGEGYSTPPGWFNTERKSGETSTAIISSVVSGGVIWACTKQIVDQISPTKATVLLIENISRVCQNRLQSEALLRDIELRRVKVYSQAYQEKVLLWMVVAITTAGVVLAGLQLLLAFKLASTGKGSLADANDVSIERGKLSLKSSVTGLLVLICSFAFFWVFVRQIYLIQESELAARKLDYEVQVINNSRFNSVEERRKEDSEITDLPQKSPPRKTPRTAPPLPSDAAPDAQPGISPEVPH